MQQNPLNSWLRGPLAAALVAGTAHAGQAEPPAGAIAVGGGVFMVPLGRDEGGCMSYRAWSAELSVVQAIFWRRPDGRFVLERPEGECGPESGETPE